MSSVQTSKSADNSTLPILRPFKSRNFTIFFIGQGTSLIGTWMENIALGWLVYRLTGSAALLGLVEFLSHIPLLLLGPFAGTFADKFNRLQIVKIAQMLMMLQASIIAYLTLSGNIEIWHLMVLGFLLGVARAFEIPARQALLIKLVDYDDLPNAIGLNASMFNGARMIGPAIAGGVVALYGEGICFLINAVSFLAVLISLYSLKLEPLVKMRIKSSVLENAKEGFKIAFSNEATRKTLFLVACTSLIGMPFLVLLPPYVKNVLGGGVTLYGWVMAFSGAGAMIAALTLVQRVRILSLPTRIGFSNLFFGIGLFIFAMLPSIPLSLIMIFILSFAFMVQNASANTLVQMVVKDELRGRVMGIYSMLFLGLLPIGALIWGVIAEHIGSKLSIEIMGSFIILSGLIYIKKKPNISHPISLRGPHTFVHGPSA